MARDNSKPERSFYFGWVWLSGFSFPIALFIALPILSWVAAIVGGTIQVGGQTHFTEDFLSLYVMLPIFGLLTGVLQYLLLRGYLPRMEWWIAATFLGWLLLAVVFALPALSSATVSPALALVLIGGSTLPQWILLRRRVRYAALWILAGILGWGAVLPLTGVISSTLGVLAIMFLPPTAAGIAWWLLLDQLPQRNSNLRNTPHEAPQEPSAPLGAG